MADTKISQLPEATSINQTDILPVVIDTGSGLENRKIKVENLLVKATGAEVNAGTDNTKIVTPKAIADSNVVITDKSQTLTNKTLVSPVIDTGISGTAKATGSEVNAGTDDTKIITPYGLKQGQALIPRVRVRQTTSQSIPSTSNTLITFQTEDFDVGNMFDAGVDNTKIVVPSGQGGIYLVGGNLQLADSGTAGKIFQLLQNGTVIADLRVGHDGYGRWAGIITTLTNANAGDYFQLLMYHQASGSLNVWMANFYAIKLI